VIAGAAPTTDLRIVRRVRSRVYSPERRGPGDPVGPAAAGSVGRRSCGFPDVSLAGAREAAREARAKVRNGVGPVAKVRGARWTEIDLDAATWTVPAERMKAAKEHRVPLSGDALAVLNALPLDDRNALVFASPRGGMLSDMSLTAVLRRMKVDAVPHGFRSSFRDWCAERTNYPREVAEMALAHAIGDKVEAAYRRGDLFEKRQGASRRGPAAQCHAGLTSTLAHRAR